MYDWDEHNTAHIAEHDVEPEEAEEALTDHDRVVGKSYNVAAERRRAIIGRTETGRLLFVVITRRGRRIRVVTAYDAEEPHRKQYRKRQRQ
jgi:uncharacterized protein